MESAQAASAIAVSTTTFGAGVATNVGVSLTGFDETQNYQVTVKFVNNSTNVDVTNGTLVATQGSTSLISGYTSFSAAKLGFKGSYAAIAAALSSMTWNPSAASGDISIRIGIASQPGTNEFYDANSGHYYKYVSTGATWTAARTAAEATYLFGLRGYLAEINSLAENNFIGVETSATNIWIGATEDATTAASYVGSIYSGAAGQKWIWQGATQAPLPTGSGGGAGNSGNTTADFSSWAGGEPNNDNKPGQDCAVTNWGSVGLWNDLGCSTSNGYLIEFGGRAGETSTAATNTLTTTVVAREAVTLGTLSTNVSCTITVNCSFPLSLTNPTAKNSSNVDVAGSFTYASSNTNSTTVASVAGGATVSYVAPGSSTITATFTPTNTALYASGTKTFTITVIGQSQASLSVTSTTGLQSGITLTSSGGSGTIAVTYAVSNGTATGCAITSGILTSSTAGTCLVTATNPANGNYASVSSSQTTVTTQAVVTYSIASSVPSPTSAQVTTGYSSGTSTTVTLTRAGNSGANPSTTLSVTGGTWTVTAGTGTSSSSGTLTSGASVTITLTASTGTYTLSLNTGATSATYTASDTATTPLSYAVVVSNSCLTGQVCASGNIGPGGGLVFYASNTPFACGPTRTQSCQGLEIAPRTWSGSTPNPKVPWALPAFQNVLIPEVNTDFGATNLTAAGIDLGWGLIDTLAIKNQHTPATTGYAAGLANSYNGGGKTDWSLPSPGEAEKIGLASALTLINNSSNYALSGSDPAITYDCSGSYASDCLWTSWQGAANVATDLRLSDNFARGYKGKGDLFFVRPVRAIFISTPTVTGISPATGVLSGGTSITITGTNFSSGASVTIGGSACTSISIVSSTSITCITPARSAGAKDVVVTNSDTGSVTQVGAFTYQVAVNYSVSSATSTPISASVTTGYSTGTSTTVTLVRAGNSGSNPTTTLSVTGGTWTVTAGTGTSASSGTVTSSAPVTITLTASSGTYTLSLDSGSTTGSYTASDTSTTQLSYVVTVSATAAPTVPRQRPEPVSTPTPIPVPVLTAITPISDKIASPYVTLNGGEISAVVKANTDQNALEVIASGWALSISVIEPNGIPAPLSPKLAIVLNPDQQIIVSGPGFKPNSEVQVYLFSTPRLIGTTTTDNKGNFVGLFPMLKDVALGDHLIQINGISPDNEVRSATLPAIFQKTKPVATRTIKNALSKKSNKKSITIKPVKTTVTCVNGTQFKKVISTNPKCPTGYKDIRTVTNADQATKPVNQSEDNGVVSLLRTALEFLQDLPSIFTDLLP